MTAEKDVHVTPSTKFIVDAGIKWVLHVKNTLYIYVARILHFHIVFRDVSHEAEQPPPPRHKYEY
jgi:hypothetical protein